MSDEQPSQQDPESIQADAVAWLVRMQSDTCSWDDWVALAEWLEFAADHRKAFDRVQALDAAIETQARGRAAGMRDHATGAASPRSGVRPKPRRWAIAGWAIAASALMAVAVGRTSEGPSSTYATGQGETRTVALSDGSTIRMNAASSMTVSMGWFARRVKLGAGEAAFEVVKDPSRPFIVVVGDEQVRDVGTAFDIRHYDERIIVTVEHGVVEVRQRRAATPSVRLLAGESLMHIEGQQGSTRLQTGATAAYAWTHGRLVCDERTLGSIVADLNRWYPTPIRVTSATSAMRFSGVLELGDEDTTARRLAAYLGLRIARTRGAIAIG